NGPSGWRIFYKGLENVIETFELIAERYSDATLTIVGKWDLEVVKNVQSRMRFGGDRLFFAGVQSDLTPFFEEASLCL
ncbi:glycosyltransferase family 4 protein, partial [Escherichia coli]|nr:glycosyltransferase family 4 protein [Escherichia coli]